jgi:hypothetical protein
VHLLGVLITKNKLTRKSSLGVTFVFGVARRSWLLAQGFQFRKGKNDPTVETNGGNSLTGTLFLGDLFRGVKWSLRNPGNRAVTGVV